MSLEPAHVFTWSRYRCSFLISFFRSDCCSCHASVRVGGTGADEREGNRAEGKREGERVAVGSRKLECGEFVVGMEGLFAGAKGRTLFEMADGVYFRLPQESTAES